MHLHRFLATSALYLSLAAADPALAGERAPGREDASRDTREQVVGDERLHFTVREQGVLTRYAERVRAEREAGADRDDRAAHGHDRHKPLPPGLQKKVERGGELPPGWKKKLARGEVLPAEVRGSARPLPEDVRRQLPPDPPGTVTVEVDGEVARVVRDTWEIVDILRGRR